MKILNLVQGSPEWVEARTKYHCASEAPIMNGDRAKPSRSDLVRMKATGAEQEFSDWVRENVLEKGHEVEALARPIAEKILGETLFPITATDDAGYLLASFDGLSMDYTVGWECKQWNEEKAEDVRNGKVPKVDYWQVVQQLVVSGAESILYMVTDGTEEKCVYLSVYLAPAYERDLRASWAQFDKDVADYKPEPAAAPPAVAAPIEGLPALAVSLVGAVQASNLAEWKGVVVARIGKINTNLQTDQDFADAASMVKFLDDAEKSLELVKKQALSQTSDIDELFRTIDTMAAAMKVKRLELDKLVAKRKEDIRGEIMQEGRKALNEFVGATINEYRLMIDPLVIADFAAVMRGKRTVATLKDAVATELARAKVEVTRQAETIATNQAAYATLATGFEFLFADLKSLLMQSPEAFAAMVENRITKHKLEVKEREEKEAAMKANAAAVAAAAATAQAGTDVTLGAIPAGTQVTSETLQNVTAANTATVVGTAVASGNVRPIIKPVEDNGARIKLGEICDALGFTVTATFLADLGFPVVTQDKNAKLYRKCDMPAICSAISGHVLAISLEYQKAA